MSTTCAKFLIKLREIIRPFSSLEERFVRVIESGVITKNINLFQERSKFKHYILNFR